MREEYDSRRRYLVENLNRIGLDCFEPKGAFYVFPCIRSSGLSSEEFCERFLREEKVAVIPGTAFDPGRGLCPPATPPPCGTSRSPSAAWTTSFRTCGASRERAITRNTRRYAPSVRRQPPTVGQCRNAECRMRACGRDEGRPDEKSGPTKYAPHAGTHCDAPARHAFGVPPPFQGRLFRAYINHKEENHNECSLFGHGGRSGPGDLDRLRRGQRDPRAEVDHPGRARL